VAVLYPLDAEPPRLPSALLARTHRTADGQLLIAHQLRCDVDGADDIREGDILVVDLARPGLERPGVYLAIWPLPGAGVAVIPGHIPDPFTRRGRLRRSFVIGAVRFLAEDHGITWLAFSSEFPDTLAFS
jgi:hypothetical protein